MRKRDKVLVVVMALIAVIGLAPGCARYLYNPVPLEYTAKASEPLGKIKKYNIKVDEARWLDVTNIKETSFGVIFDHDFMRVTVHGKYIIEIYYVNE